MKERMCCVCRTKKPMTELIRIARIDGKFHVDKIGNMNGRGAHLCNTPVCIEKCIKTRQLNRSFKQNIPADVYEKLSHLKS